MKVASDAGPLIWLSQIERFDLLRALFETVVITPEVWAETVDRAAGYPNAAEVSAAHAAGWIRIIPAEDTQRVAVLKAHLDSGEAETLVMAQEQGVAAVLVDDLQARHLGAAMGLKIVGTAGILLLAKITGIELDIKASLDRMRLLGFRLGDRVYEDILEKAGKNAVTKDQEGDSDD